MAQSPLRTAFANKIGDKAMVPEVEKSLQLWKPNVTIERLKQHNLSHFLPVNTARENLVKHIKRGEFLNTMHTIKHDPKYGGLKPTTADIS